ncbi:hypothetical protein [Fulvivirga sediminis]|nr:hypothetical protein [Fulvivirga sediminis]
MALYNLDNHKEAMDLLLNVIGTTSNDTGVQEDQEAIAYYSDKT